ncbi:amino acid adenylation domain-containing protein [Streptomyces kaniharaensis]|uniref:Amino acid adenylation domain-containing protein n=1 Tax=Streptomyces kaniharaensis TaxID=212423 RepID=A0A6N7KM86_9ACTN|nr:non-ribosomal peptide synthetase [Streptomyces kaniharaensis]MQS10733.1 amino acid adenylation domain-containing protein [Streptomyces kaniharaensis]
MTDGTSVLRGPRVPHRAPYGIPGLVRDQRLRTPDAVACSDPHRSLTYTELDLLSDAAAAAVLRATGGRRGAVAVRMPRQTDLLVALLGILKAGCHYVPIATDEPAERVAAMVDTVRPLCTVVAQRQEALAPDGAPAVTVPRTPPADASPLREVAPDDPVYALFTSGSTGTPKAVLVGAAALANRILWMSGRFGLDGRDRVLQKTPSTFDVAGWEFFLPVVTGARCVFAPPDAHYDPQALGRVVDDEGITVCHFVPTVLDAHLRLTDAHHPSLRLVFCSGEPLPPALAARCAERFAARLHNLYGPTEAGIDVTHWPVPRGLTADGEVLIGAPIDNVDLRVLGPGGEPVPDGEPGELWIGGVQVALGYVGRPDLTEAAFAVRDGRRWYRTGDLVRAEGGLLRHLGRTDAQLKIRGVRIEPAEVEAALTTHPAVGAAAVVAVRPPGGAAPELVAVAVRTRGRAGADHEILAHVADRLPRAFVPHTLRWVERLPLTSSGKADRRRIGTETARWWASAVAGPDEPLDELARVWWEVLAVPADRRREDVGFLSLGGHSLAALTLLARVAQLYRIEVPLPLLLLENLTLAGLRTLVARTPRGPRRPASAAPADHSPLTPVQEPLWLLNRALADDSGNNVVGALRISAAVDGEALRAAARDVVERHDLLRAAVQATSGVPRWSYAPHADPPITTRTLTRPFDEAAVRGFVAEIATRAVPLDRPPLLNLGLLHGPGEALLVLSLHHLVADQHALELVAGDLAAAYTARAAGLAPEWPPAPSFAAFAHERADTAGSARWHDDLAYWERLLRDAPARTPLPFRLTGPAAPTLAGRRATAVLGADLSAAVDALLIRTGHTRATYVLACVTAVLAAWTGEESVAVGVPVSRRLHPEEPELVGPVLTTVPLWLDAGKYRDRDELLDHVRERSLEALGHATPTFQAIVRRLGLPPSPRDNPLFQVWVNDLSRVGPAPGFAGTPARWVDAAPPAALFDLNFYLRHDASDGYRIELLSREGLFDDAVVAELLRQVVEVATAFAEDRPPFGLPAPTPPAPEVAPAAPDVLARIRAVAARHPDALAVIGPQHALTYVELVRACERVAADVTAAGIGPGDVLELRATRTPGLPAALLGARQAGAAVAITDAGLPGPALAERQELLRPKAVLTVDGLAPGSAHEPRRLPGISHVLFTSGTSGRPAAVAVPPTALAATLDWYGRTFGLGPQDRIALLGGLGHDPLLRDVLAPLLAGGTAVVPPESAFTAPDRLFALLDDERITVLHATPALLELILSGRPAHATARLPHLRLVVSGGAPLTAGLVRSLRTVTAAPVVNAYGATETPQLASVWQLAAGQLPPAGLPDTAELPVGTGAGASDLLVLRPDGTPAPVGHTGEVVVRSPHLAAGYLDAAGRSDRFDAAAGTYRTGDRGRRDPSGAVVLHGRLDRQLSVNGYRLDPEQVERAALDHPAVRRAVAGLTPTAAGPVLSLSVRTAPGATTPDSADLRSHLRRLLPRYAVPTEIRVTTGEAPGDRSDRSKAAGAAAPAPAPGTPQDGQLAAQLAGLVREIVGLDLPPADNFFDAGLNSMAVVRLHALLCERLATAFPVTAMFEHPNLLALARFLSGEARTAPPPALRGGPPGSPASPVREAEQRLQLRRRIRHDLRRQV